MDNARVDPCTRHCESGRLSNKMASFILYFFLSCGPVEFRAFASMDACEAARDQITEFDGLCLEVNHDT